MLDHGILNIPLSKRGNIDNQIDAYKAQKAKEEKQERDLIKKERAALKAEAKELYNSLTREQLQKVAKHKNVKLSELRTTLKAFCDIAPKRAKIAIQEVINIAERI